MTRLYCSIALGIAAASLAWAAHASTGGKQTTEAGCSKAQYMDTPSAENRETRFWLPDAQDGARVQPVVANLPSPRSERIAEQLGRGYRGDANPLQAAADKLLPGSHSSDSTGTEPKTALLLLAALSVVTFVARRRRID